MPCFPANATSLANRFLTKDIYNKLIHLKTGYGFTLFDAIRSGIENPDSSIGIYAGDVESYVLFSDIFRPVIGMYHGITPLPSSNTPTPVISTNISYFGSDLTAVNLPDPDPEHEYILSTRIRVARNIDGFPFTPIISSADRNQVEKIIIEALEYMESPLKGEYHPIQSGLTQSCFRKGDRFQESAGINRDWPDSRGVFESEDKKFVVWVNEEDHLRIISIDKTGNISGVFNRLISGLNTLEKALDCKNISFAWNGDLGYLTACPSNLGTGMRAGVHIRLPKLFREKKLLDNAANKLQLQIRGTSGEKTEVESAVFDISNIQRLGVTERQCCETLYKGVCKIIKLEKRL